MKTETKGITIRELVNGYKDNGEGGVFGYGGKLNIRPEYQREFIYKEKQRDDVIDSITKDYTLGLFHFFIRKDGHFEIIDGQQRTVSICQYVEGDFSVKVGNFSEKRAFHNLQDDEQDQIKNYKLLVSFCSGADSEKLAWFKRINAMGEKVNDQEMLNAAYSGPWVTDARRHFSKTSGPAYVLGGDYLNGTAIRQDYLETAIKWISKGDIEGYMSTNQHKPNAEELWLYFQSVIDWIRATFSAYRQEMKGVPWGELYNEFKDQKFDPNKLETEISRLIGLGEVKKKSGLYSYVLDGKEQHLDWRAFDDNQKREMYERQKGICPHCKIVFKIKEMEGDHVLPQIKGGRTFVENGQMLCKECNRRKSKN